jgi:hypothetical protein
LRGDAALEYGTRSDQQRGKNTLHVTGGEKHWQGIWTGGNERRDFQHFGRGFTPSWLKCCGVSDLNRTGRTESSNSIIGWIAATDLDGLEVRRTTRLTSYDGLPFRRASNIRKCLRQESNLVRDLRRVACLLHTPETESTQPRNRTSTCGFEHRRASATLVEHDKGLSTLSRQEPMTGFAPA